MMDVELNRGIIIIAVIVIGAWIKREQSHWISPHNLYILQQGLFYVVAIRLICSLSKA